MIGLEDRQALAKDIHAAHTTGARLKPACAIAGIDLRTLQRWKAMDGVIRGDGRPLTVRATPRHALSETERAQVLSLTSRALLRCHQRASSPCWPTTVFIWPANPRSAVC